MTKNLLLTAIFATMTICCPSKLHASEMDCQAIPQASAERQIAITASATSIIVNGAEGMTLEIVSITGRHVAKIKIESPSQKVETGSIPKGLYIVKVGNVVRKIKIN